MRPALSSDYTQKDQSKRFFSCQDLSLDVLVKVLRTIPQIRTWKIEGRKKGPHTVFYTVKAYRILRDHGTDPKMKKEALICSVLHWEDPEPIIIFCPKGPKIPFVLTIKPGPVFTWGP